MPDEEAVRKIRAKRLKEQIDRLMRPGEKPEEDPAIESPREFIHRKMRERDKRSKA